MQGISGLIIFFFSVMFIIVVIRNLHVFNITYSLNRFKQ
jgi:hypothetical protein